MNNSMVDRIEALLEEAREKIYNSTEKGMQALKQAYELSIEHNYDQGEAWALLRMGSYAFKEGNRYAAIEQYKRGLEKMQALGNYQGVARGHYLLATVYSLIGEFSTALKYYLEAMKLSEEYDQAYHHKVLNNIASTYYRLGQYDHGIATIQLAINFMMSHDIEGLYLPYTTLGEIYLSMEAYKEALECAEKALEYLEGEHDIRYMANADMIIAEAFKGLKFYDESLIVYNRAFKQYEQSGDTQNYVRIHRDIAEIYLIKKEFEYVFKHLQTALTLSNKYESMYDESKVYDLYSRVYEVLGDFEKAYKYKKKSSDMEHRFISENSRVGYTALNDLSEGLIGISPIALVEDNLFDRVIGELSSTYKNVSYIEKSELTDAFVEAIVDTADMRDTTTTGHSKRIARYSTEMLKSLSEDQLKFKDISFTDIEIKEMYYASLLHDIGKLAVSEEVLLKNQRLSQSRVLALNFRFDYLKLYLSNKKVLSEIEEKILTCMDECLKFVKSLLYKNYIDDQTYEKLVKIHEMYVMVGDKKIYLIDNFEFEHLSVREGNLVYYELEDMRTHATMTKKILEGIPWIHGLKDIPLIASSHHEKLDGSGYPKGLKGHEITIQMRILSIIDIFEALTASDRPYKASMPIEKAIDILREEAKAGKLDADLVEYFVSSGICYLFKGEIESKS